MPTDKPTPLLRGTLDMMILRAVLGGPKHGYAVVKFLADTSDDVVRVEEGSLYPALHRLETKGWLRASWGRSDNGRRAKFYELTARGRRQLDKETLSWTTLSRAITAVMTPAPEGA